MLSLFEGDETVVSSTLHEVVDRVFYEEFRLGTHDDRHIVKRFEQQIFIFDEDGNEPYFGPVQCRVPQLLNMSFCHLQEDDAHITAVLPQLFEAIIDRLEDIDFVTMQYFKNFT